MSSIEGSPAPKTPPSPEIGVRAIIALPSLELTASFSPNDNALEKLPSLVNKVSEQFDQAFSPEIPFDFVDFKCYPEMNSDEEATTFRECLPDHRNVALIVEPTPHHGSLMKRLKETIEAERRQHKLIMEMESESGSATTRKKGKNRKKTRSSTPTQATTDYQESFRNFDLRLSALEQDNVELKRDNVKLKQDNVKLTQDNVELKNTVDRHWRSISALSRRALLDDARLVVVSETKLSLAELYAEFHQNSQRAAETFSRRLRTEAQISLSPHSMKMIFGFEIAGRARGTAAQTVREKGNAAAHEFGHDDVLSSVLQEDLTEPQRVSLQEIYTVVCGHPPTFTA